MDILPVLDEIGSDTCLVLEVCETILAQPMTTWMTVRISALCDP